MMRRFRAAGFALGLLALVGCSTSPAELNLCPRATTKTKTVSSDDHRQTIVLRPIEDRRPEGMRQQLGVVGGRGVLEKNSAAWVEAALIDLNGHNFRVVKSSDGQAPTGWLAKPRILQLYTSSLNVAKTATVVIELELVGPENKTSIHTYNGRIAAANWGSGEEEIENSLRKALQKCLKQMRSDLELVSQAGAQTKT